MAALANTFLTTGAVGNREELSDIVSRITPEDTPIYSTIPKGTCDSIHPEWEIDDLAAPAENIVTEGDEYTYDATVAPARVGGYTQIMRKTWIISNTQEAVDNAGSVEKRKYQKLKKGVEIKKDAEFAILNNNASVGGATREIGGLPTWVTTNVSRGTGGANGGYNSGTGLTVAATDGTQRAFSKALMDDVMEQGYTNGANFKHGFVSPYVKSVFVTFMSDSNVAQFRYAASGAQNTIVANADVYEGPYGKVMIQPNRVAATNATLARNVHLVDPDMLDFKWLRKIQSDNSIANTGDADKGVIIGEGLLCPKNQQGLGVVADVFGLTAST